MKKKLFLIFILICLIAGGIYFYQKQNLDQKETQKPKKEIVLTEDEKKLMKEAEEMEKNEDKNEQNEEEEKERFYANEEDESERMKFEKLKNIEDIEKQIKEIASQDLYIYEKEEKESEESSQVMEFKKTQGQDEGKEYGLLNKKIIDADGSLMEISYMIMNNEIYSKNAVDGVITKYEKNTEGYEEEKIKANKLKEELDGRSKTLMEDLDLFFKANKDSKQQGIIKTEKYKLEVSQLEEEKEDGGKRIVFVNSKTPLESYIYSLENKMDGITEEEKEKNYRELEMFLSTSSEIEINLDKEGKITKIEVKISESRTEEDLSELSYFMEMEKEEVQINRIYNIIPKWEIQNYEDKYMLENYKTN